MTDDAEQIVTTVRLATDDPMFVGHFPGCPVLPGVALIDLVDRAVTAGLSGCALIHIESGRFLQPVSPGDDLRITAARFITSTGLSCDATVDRNGTRIARIRLSYQRKADR